MMSHLTRRLATPLLLFTLTLVFSTPAQGVTRYENKSITSLQSITTKGDFPQKGLTEKAIERKIKKIIGAHNKRDIYSLEIPYNRKKLRAKGWIHPRKLGLFARGDFRRHLNNLNRPFLTYQYGDFYILSEGRTKKDFLQVFFAIRAVNLLQYRYSKAYQVLVEGMGKLPLSLYGKAKSQKVAFSWINVARANLIVFDSTIKAIASNIYDLGPAISLDKYLAAQRLSSRGFYRSDLSQIKVYQNSSLVYLNPKSIQGKGSKRIYKYSHPWKNYLHYLRDGLVESIVHERTHGYISAYYNLDKKCRYLRKKGHPTYYFLEEPVVNNTSITYFSRQGGLSKAVIKYYRRVFHGLLYRRLQLGGAYQRIYRELKKTKPHRSANNYRGVFRLGILD